MIQNKEFTFAENKLEALWVNTRDNCKLRIQQLKDSIPKIEESLLIEQEFLELCEAKCREFEKEEIKYEFAQDETKNTVQ